MAAVSRRLAQEGRVIHELATRRPTDCLFESLVDAIRLATPAVTAAAPPRTAGGMRRALARHMSSAGFFSRWVEPIGTFTESSWGDRCKEYEGGRMGDEWTIKAAVCLYDCGVRVVHRQGELLYSPKWGPSSVLRVVTLAYFDAVDYQHYASTRRVPGLRRGASSFRRASGGPGDDNHILRGGSSLDGASGGAGGTGAVGSGGSSVSGGDGAGAVGIGDGDAGDGLLECGGMRRSDVQAVLDVVEARCACVQSVLNWVAARVLSPPSAEGRCVSFRGVSFTPKGGGAQAIFGGVRRNRGSGWTRYLECCAAVDTHNLIRESARIRDSLDRRVRTATVRVETLRGFLFKFGQGVSAFTEQDGERLSFEVAQILIDLDGAECRCAHYACVPVGSGIEPSSAACGGYCDLPNPCGSGVQFSLTVEQRPLAMSLRRVLLRLACVRNCNGT